MNDISFQIGLDIQQALSDLDKLKTSIKQGLSQNVDTSSVKGLANEFNSVASAARSSLNEQKAALASLIATGKQGSAAYNDLLNTIKANEVEANKMADAYKQVEAALNNAAPSLDDMKNSLASMVISGKEGTDEYKKLFQSVQNLTNEEKKFDDALNKVNKDIRGTTPSLNEQKAALAQIIQNGQSGSAAFNDMLKNISKTVAETRKLEEAEKQADAEIKKYMGEVEKAPGVFAKLKESFTLGLGIGAGAFGIEKIIEGVKGLGSAMIGSNKEFETYKVQLTTLMGSAKDAEKRLAELADFGAKTPFELPELVRAEKVLLGFGFNTSKTMKLAGKDMDQFRTIVGDIAAGTGQQFEEIALLFGKFGAGATGEAIARFQELGIATKEQLEEMGIKFDKAGSLVSPLPKAFEAAVKLAQQKFGGGMDKLSATASGQLSTLSDNIGAGLRKIGEPIFAVFKQLVEQVNNTLGSAAIQNSITILGNVLAGIISAGFGVIKFFADWYPLTLAMVGVIGGFTIALNAAAIATKAKLIWDTAAAVATGIWTAAQTALNIVMGANPIGLVVAGIALLVGGIIAAYKNSETFRGILEKLWAGIKTVGAVFLAVGKSIYEYLKLYFVTAFDVIKGIISTIGNVVSKVFSLDFSGAIEEAKKGGEQIGKSVVDNVKGAANNVKGAWTEAGKDIGKMWEDTKKKTDNATKDIKKVIDANIPAKKEITIDLALNDKSISSLSKQFDQVTQAIQGDAAAKKGAANMLAYYAANAKAAQDKIAQLRGEYDLATKQSEKDALLQQIYLIENATKSKKAALKVLSAADKQQKQVDRIQANTDFALDKQKQTELANAKKVLLADIAKLQQQLNNQQLKSLDDIYTFDKQNFVAKQELDRQKLQGEIKALQAGNITAEASKNIANKQLELEKLIIQQRIDLRAFEAEKLKADFEKLINLEQTKTDNILGMIQSRKAALDTQNAATGLNLGDVNELNALRVRELKLQGEKEANAYIEGLKIYQDQYNLVQENLKRGLDPAIALQQLQEFKQNLAQKFIVGDVKGVEEFANAYKNILLQNDLKVKQQQKINSDDARKAEINNAKTTTEVILGLEIFAAQKAMDEKIKAANGGNALMLDAYIEFLGAKAVAEKKAALETASGYAKLALDASDVLIKSLGELQFTQPKPDNSKAIADENKQYEESKKKFKEDLDAKKISYEDYLKQITKLDGDHNKQVQQLQASQVDGWKIVNDVLAKAFENLAAKRKEDLKVITKSYEQIDEAIRQQVAVVKKAEDEKGKSSKEAADASIQLTLMQQKHAEILSKVYQATGEQVGATFVSMIASGENAGKALAKAALSGLKSLVPILIAEIFGQSLAQLGPIGGAIAAAGLSAVFYGLIAVAEASIGAETGYLPGQKLGKKGRTDTQLIWFNPKEAIISEQNYARNKSIIDSIQMYGHPGGFNDNNIVKELQMTRQELAKHKSVEVYDRRVIDINDNRSVQVRSANLYR